MVQEMNFSHDVKVIPRLVENIMSLNVASEMSVKLIESCYPKDLNLLYLLGCLPGGFTQQQLEAM